VRERLNLNYDIKRVVTLPMREVEMLFRKEKRRSKRTDQAIEVREAGNECVRNQRKRSCAIYESGLEARVSSSSVRWFACEDFRMR
jgi:DNA-binding IclR family transcriptional regulator